MTTGRAPRSRPGPRPVWVLAGAVTAALPCIALALSLQGARPPSPEAPPDPLAFARASQGPPVNREPTIVPQCYADVRGGANPCWTCHTVGVDPHSLVDTDLQSEYSFSDGARRSAWANLFEDRRPEIAEIGDGAVLAHVRGDNYNRLRASLTGREDYPGYVPDLDLDAGFDEGGYARDGSGWRALRYKPFPGAFWPTNSGSAGEVYVRLPVRFRADEGGRLSRAVEDANWAILEAAITATPGVPTGQLVREVSPVDEARAGLDLDGDGRVLGTVTRIRGLPARYAGFAKDRPVARYLFPAGMEILHPVRYIDPDAPRGAARRLKELRYARKVEELDAWALQAAYQREADEKDEGRVPVFRGGPEVGLRNAYGWQLQAFIEDDSGRLRLQTAEEHRFCMGCHGSTGVAIDSTFSFARKVPGAAGWRVQDLAGIPDVPQAGHGYPEVLTYLRRAGGGDDFRGNPEMAARFFPGGALDEPAVRSAPDMAALVVPSRERALLLDKAYLALVRTQRFDLGRDPVVTPPAGARAHIPEERTGLEEAKRTYLDGRLHLAWGGRE